MQDRSHERVGAVLSHTSLCIGRAHDEVRSKRHGHSLKHQRLHTHSQDQWKEPSTMATDFRVRRRERPQEMCHDVINTGLAHAARTRAWSERGCADAPRHKQAAAISAAAAAENATLLPTDAKGEITCITLLCMKAKVKVAGGRRE